VQVPRFGLKRQSDDDENELLDPSRDGLRVKSRQDESFLISVGAQTPVAQRFLNKRLTRLDEWVDLLDEVLSRLRRIEDRLDMLD